jgi:hypothetical protein
MTLRFQKQTFFRSAYIMWVAIMLPLSARTVCAATEQSANLIQIPYSADAKLAIDGSPADAVWAQGAVLNLDYEIDPKPPSSTAWKTEARLVQNGTHLYVLVKAADPSVGDIVAQNTKFDALAQTDDSIVVYVTSFVGSKRSFAFQANARGARADFISSSTGDAAPDWNGTWNATSTINQNGYVVAFEIPWKTVGIDAQKGSAQKISLNIERRIGRGRNELLSSAPISRLQPCRECQFFSAEVSLPKKVDEKAAKLRVQPYVIATKSAKYDAATGNTTESNQQADIGVDMTWQITPRDVLVATLNPDFSQVEIDSIRFEINQRFANSFAERRVFFTNESGIFRTGMPLIYTRALVDPTYGLQFVRRRDNYELGVLYVRDDVTSFILPDEESSSSIFSGTQSQNLAARLNYRINDSFSVGALTTYRSADDYHNGMTSLDSTWSINKQNELSVQVAQSSTCDDATIIGAAGIAECNSGNAYSLSHSFGSDDWYSDTSYSHYDKHFRADLGLLSQVGVSDFDHTTGYIKQISHSKWLERMIFSGSYGNQYSDTSGLLYQNLLLRATASSKSASLTLQVDRGEEAFEGSQFFVTGASLGYSQKLSGKTNFSIILGSRDSIDYSDLELGKQQSWSLGVNFKPSSSFDGRIFISGTKFDLPDRPLFSTELMTLRGEYHLNAFHHLTGLLNVGQSHSFTVVPGGLTESTNRTASYQVSYQYKPSAFRYFILGLSGGGRGNDVISGIQPTSSYAFAKYVFDFSW